MLHWGLDCHVLCSRELEPSVKRPSIPLTVAHGRSTCWFYCTHTWSMVSSLLSSVTFTAQWWITVVLVTSAVDGFAFHLSCTIKKNLTCGVFLTVLQSFWFEYEIHHQQRKWVYSFPLGCEFCHWSRLVVTSATTPSFPCCTGSRKRCRKCVLCADIAFSSDRCARSQTRPDFLLFYEVFPGIWGLFFHCSVVVCGWNLSLSVVCLSCGIQSFSNGCHSALSFTGR